VTGLGKKVGGVEFEGGTYVLWTPELKDNRTLFSSLNTGEDNPNVNQQDSLERAETNEDLKDSKKIRDKFPASLRTKGGHLVRSREEIFVDNSLYEYGLAHAYERRLPINAEVYCDFYIPSQNNGKAVYIEYWGV